MKIKPITEKAFMAQVIQLAKLRGWRTAHFRPQMNRRGVWSTAVAGDGVGFPDLVLVRGRRIMVVELKVGKNKPTAEQSAWLWAFEQAGVENFVWTPEKWEEIERTLQ